MDALLDISHLHTSFFTPVGEVRAVRDVSFSLRRGEVLGIVGESGSGKSVTMLSILRLLGTSGRVVEGSIRFDGTELAGADDETVVNLRGNRIGMIFQDPMTSLNPVLSVGYQLMEPLIRHRGMTKAQARERAIAMLRQVGIDPAEKRIDQYPHQFSGGQRQRIMIAMALTCDPALLIADEPTTALDVTIQAQILDLLLGVQSERGMGMLLITHDLGVVARMAHRVGVMYAGEVVEEAPRAAFFAHPRHPYTLKLFAALPDLSRRGGRLETIAGQVPPLAAMPTGCRFAERCPQAFARCRVESPGWSDCGDGHRVRCHWVAENRHSGESRNLTEGNAEP